LNGTVIAYGSSGLRRQVSAKASLAASAPASVAADRLAYNAASGKTVQGDGELLDALKGGSVKLESIKKADLPEEYQRLDDAELKTKVAEKQKERTGLQTKIQQLAKDRDAFIAAEQKRLAAAGKGDSFDAKVAEMIHSQAARKGINYSK
jgi:hypothetical protein